MKRDYNFIVTDWGVIGSIEIQEAFVMADIYGSALSYELPIFY